MCARAACLVALFAAFAHADSAPDADAAIADLYKSGKLFDKKEYKAVRAAFADRFEKRHADDMKSAFGGDHVAILAWLNAHAEAKHEFFIAIHEDRDRIVPVLKLFAEFWRHSPEQLAKYWNLAIATAVVWDEPRKGVYDYRHHQVRIHATMPDGYAEFAGIDAYRYFLDREKEIQGRESVNRAQVLPWEFLIYIVDHRTPVSERDWAIKAYGNRKPLIGRVYAEIQYDDEMLRTNGRTCKLDGHPYTLESIRRHGGVCAMQGDYASRVAKSLGVPAVYVGGEAANLGLHAWVMWCEFKTLNAQKIEFSYLSYGQYPDLKHYTGELVHPQTGEQILDRDMERTLAVVGFDRAAKRQADLAMRAYGPLREKLDVAKKLAFVDQTLKVCAFNEAAWTELAALCKADEFKGTPHVPAVYEHIETLLKTFRANPDFSWKVFDDLAGIQPDIAQRTRLYEKIVAMYEVGGRPDLACEARIKLSVLQTDQSKYKIAATGLAFTVEKFPNEGRYVPKLIARLGEVCEAYPEGTKMMAELYVRLLPKIPVRRAGEVSDYAIKMHEQAIKFFKDNETKFAKDKKLAGALPVIEASLAKLKSSAKKGG